MIHPTAIVETQSIGPTSNVWAYAHVMEGAVVGERVNIGDHAFVEGGAIVGDNVTIKNGVCIWDGIKIENDVFVGPNVTFTNDRLPRSPRMEAVRQRYAAKENWLCQTVVKRGCSIGAGAILCPGVSVGEFATIGAGAVVTRDVEPHSLVVGNPASKIGDVCSCGGRLHGSYRESTCSTCGETPEARLSAPAAKTKQDEASTKQLRVETA